MGGSVFARVEIDRRDGAAGDHCLRDAADPSSVERCDVHASITASMGPRLWTRAAWLIVGLEIGSLDPGRRAAPHWAWLPAQIRIQPSLDSKRFQGATVGWLLPGRDVLDVLLASTDDRNECRVTKAQSNRAMSMAADAMEPLDPQG